MSQEQQQIFPYLQRLLNGAPVEWKPLGDVVKTITPPGKIKGSDYQLKGVLPIIDQGIELIGGYTDNTSIALPKEQYIIFGDHSEHIKYIDYSFVQGADGLKILTTDKAIPKYIYYAFTNNYQKEGKYKRHWSTAKETIIPIPPMEVQERIVEVLDKFTELERELERELELRKKQYTYFREHLLTFKEGAAEWTTIGDVAQIKNGKDYKHLKSGNIPVYGSGGIMTYVSDFSYNQPSVLIPRKGSLNNLFYVETPFWNVDTIFYTIINTKRITPKFFYYYLSILHLEKLNLAGGVPSLTQKVLNKIEIPIPPLAEQERIVGILDRFETMVHSIKEGLPREIELRRKQYEYFRDQLLTFPKE